MKVAGRWCYLYRAIDRDGSLFDSMLSEHHDKHAARCFLRRLIEGVCQNSDANRAEISLTPASVSYAAATSIGR